jgi:hypothetical protein
MPECRHVFAIVGEAKFNRDVGQRGKSVTSRYFKFTDGKRTYFRGSASRIYQAGWSVPNGANGFSAEPAERDQFPTIEIDGKEFRALQVAKRKRLRAAGWRHLKLASKIDSWVWNRGLPSRKTEAESPAATAPVVATSRL